MLIGSMRVLTGEQNLNLQQDGLQRGGCGKIYGDVCSGIHPAACKPSLIKTIFLSSPSC